MSGPFLVEGCAVPLFAALSHFLTDLKLILRSASGSYSRSDLISDTELPLPKIACPE
jgi:hypothetical protein